MEFFLKKNQFSSSGSIQVSLNGVVVLRTASSVISLNTPYLISLTKDGKVMRVFVNGKPIHSITNAPSVNITNNVMYLGYNFVGVLDKVAIYPSALTQDEISTQINGLSIRNLSFFFFSFFFSFSFVSKLISLYFFSNDSMWRM